MKHFTISELCASRTAAALGIDNTPPPAALHNLVQLTDRVLDPARELWGAPLLVSSGYRCAALNAALPGASPSSQHLLGLAADLVAMDRSPRSNLLLFERLRDSGIPYDQLIAEHWDGRGGCAWVHVGCSAERPPRRMAWRSPRPAARPR